MKNEEENTGEMGRLAELLGSLPRRELSTDFDTRLFERLADIDRARTKSRLPQFLRFRLPLIDFRPRTIVLGAGMAAAAVAGILFFGRPVSPPPAMRQSAAVRADAQLVSQCVEQQRIAVSTQPLSDPAAQNLASDLDSSPGTPSTGDEDDSL